MLNISHLVSLECKLFMAVHSQDPIMWIYFVNKFVKSSPLPLY